MRYLRSAALTACIAAAALLLGSPSAEADVGIESVSRSAGAPGEEITLALGCGFCFPPCHGAPGHRNGPCMLGAKGRRPPAAFPISLVPVGQVPDPSRCDRDGSCLPPTLGPPALPPFVLLGRATPAARRDGAPPAHNVPRYRLRFRIPEVKPGAYAYVIYCGVCFPGRRGSLIYSPASPDWRLRVHGSAAQPVLGFPLN
jgi:hypothetical protein